jgi:hypothetical protein
MSSDLDKSLRTSHRTVLAMIGVCAVVSWIQPTPLEEPAPDPTLTTIAIGLGLAVILLRGSARSSVVSPRTRTLLVLAAYASAFGLALLGAFLAVNADQPRTGLAFSLAALIFSLRPPGPSAPNG